MVVVKMGALSEPTYAPTLTTLLTFGLGLDIFCRLLQNAYYALTRHRWSSSAPVPQEPYLFLGRFLSGEVKQAGGPRIGVRQTPYPH
jgi:hypothetical protein